MSEPLPTYLSDAIYRQDRGVVESWLRSGWADPAQVHLALREVVGRHWSSALAWVVPHASQGVKWAVHWSTVANHAECMAAALALTPVDFPRHGAGSHASSFRHASRRGLLKMAQLMAPFLDLPVVAPSALRAAAAAGEVPLLSWLLPQVVSPEDRVAAYHAALHARQPLAAEALADSFSNEALRAGPALTQSLAQSLLSGNLTPVPRLLPLVPGFLLAGMAHRMLCHRATPKTYAAVNHLAAHIGAEEQDRWLTWAPPGALPAFHAAQRARALAQQPLVVSPRRRRRS